MENEENFFQKWGFIVFVFLMGVAIVFCIFKYSKPSIASEYAKQTINILEDFKDAKITADEAYDRIEIIENRVDEEREMLDLNNNEDLDLLSFSITLQQISWELVKDKNTMSSESFTITEINEYISELKKHH